MADPSTAPSLRIALFYASTVSSVQKRCPQSEIPALLVNNSEVLVKYVWSPSKQAAQQLACKFDAHVIDTYPNSQHEAPLQSAQAVFLEHISQVDAVVLAGPISRSAEFASAVLKNDLHLLQVKAFTRDVRLTSELLSTTTLSDVVHAVVEDCRFELVFSEAKVMIRKTCEKVIALQLTVQSPMLSGCPYASEWCPKDVENDVLKDDVVHHIAGMRVILGCDVETVATTCLQRSTRFTGWDTVLGNLTFTSGVPGSILLSYGCNTSIWQLRVIGTKGDVVVQRRNATSGYTLSSMTCIGDTRVTTETEMEVSGLNPALEAFIQSCRIRKVHPGLDVREAFNDITTVEAVLKSSEKGGSLSVRQINKTPING